MTRGRRGFALMAAMWLVVLLGVVGYELGVGSRARRLAAANSLELVSARAAADAGIATALAALQDSLDVWSQRPRFSSESGRDPFITFEPRLDTLKLENARSALTGYDPAGRLQLNRASVSELRRFLAAFNIDAGDADRLAQRITDWRDADNTPQPRGGERDDYLRSGARRLPANAPFGDLAELRAVDGFPPALYDRIAPHLTLLGVGQVNLNSASREVLASLTGFGDEAVAAVLRLRSERRIIGSLDDLMRELSRSAAQALRDAAPELANRVTFETRQLVIVADGWVDGSPIRAHTEVLAERSGSSVVIQSRRTHTD